jgi:hypothetical protein
MKLTRRDSQDLSTGLLEVRGLSFKSTGFLGAAGGIVGRIEKYHDRFFALERRKLTEKKN